MLYLVQNLFPKNKESRTISLNSQYMVVFKNPRDASQKVSVPADKLYYVQAVLQRRKVGRRTKALVKLFGYLSKFNSWIDAKAVVHSTIKTSHAYGDTSFEK